MIFKKKPVEKRQYKRKNCYCIIRYKPVDKTGDYFEAITSLKNISEGGILFKSKQYLPIDLRLEIKVNIPAVRGIVDVLGRVVRLEKIKGEERCWVGVMFLNIKSDSRKKLIDFLNLRRR